MTLGASLFDRALETIRPGVRETEVAAAMEYAARRAGAEAMSFETILLRESARLAPWPGFAGCHPGRGIRGLRFRCYTLGLLFRYDPHRICGSSFCGSPRNLPGSKAGTASCVGRRKTGHQVPQVDRAARKSLRESGLAKYFTHSTGHGVGLEIHEAPRVAAGQPKSCSREW